MYNRKRRLFVGISLSDALRKRLRRETESFLPAKDALIPTLPDNLHITLFFLGFVDEGELPEVCRKVEEACGGHRSFELFFTGMTLVDGPDRPQMIWLTGEPSEPLRMLRESIERAFSSFVAEKKSFRPHVTLAKVKKAKWHKLAEKPKLKEKLALVDPVESVSVFESLSIDGKRRYEAIDTFALQ